MVKKTGKEIGAPVTEVNRVSGSGTLLRTEQSLVTLTDKTGQGPERCLSLKQVHQDQLRSLPPFNELSRWVQPFSTSHPLFVPDRITGWSSIGSGRRSHLVSLGHDQNSGYSQGRVSSKEAAFKGLIMAWVVSGSEALQAVCSPHTGSRRSAHTTTAASFFVSYEQLKERLPATFELFAKSPGLTHLVSASGAEFVDSFRPNKGNVFR